MSPKEVDRLDVVRRVLDRRLRQKKAAELLGVRSRQVRRMCTACERELFVLRRYRRGGGVGRQAVVLLWDQLPGHWIVRVAEGNRAALPFWSRVIAGYTRQRFSEEERTVAGRRWIRFAFDSRFGARRT